MRIFFSSFFIIFLSVTGYSQKLLTLEEAVNIALQRNTILQKSVNSIDSYKSNVKADRKSTRLNSSHLGISYAVFCLKKKKNKDNKKYNTARPVTRQVRVQRQPGN